MKVRHDVQPLDLVILHGIANAVGAHFALFLRDGNQPHAQQPSGLFEAGIYERVYAQPVSGTAQG